MQYIQEGGFSMERKDGLKIWELSALLSLCICLCLGLWAEGRQQRLSEGLIRLHVLAVSDAPEEQAVKLKVRNAVLACLAPRLAGVQDAAEAEAVLTGELDAVAEAARSAAGGRPVTVTLTDERYPTRIYGGFALPAGRYRSLRVVLGEGQGHNWWCVVFPPACLSAVQGDALRPAMNPDDYALITQSEGWQLRFRTLELWGELVNRWEQVKP